MSITWSDLDFEGAREVWTRIFDITYSEFDRLYKEAYEKRTGYYNTYWRMLNDARLVTLAASNAGDGGVAGVGALALAGGPGDSGVTFGAALASLMRPTIGLEGGITQADYDLLSAPWRTVIGRLHEEDERSEHFDHEKH